MDHILHLTDLEPGFAERREIMEKTRVTFRDPPKEELGARNKDGTEILENVHKS